MKLPAAILLLLTAAAGFHACADEAAPSLALAGPASSGGDPAEIAPLHAFTGGPLTFDLTAQAPLGTRLRVVASLVQATAGGLAATLEKNVPVGPELVFDRLTCLVTPCTLPDLPPVQRITRTILTLRTEPAASPEQARALIVPVFLYPPEVAGAWQKTVAAELTRAGLRRLALFGPGRHLRQFFRSRRVTCEDIGDDWPQKPDLCTLYLGELPSPAVSRVEAVPGVRLAIFGSPTVSPLPPGVYQTADGRGGSIWKVTLAGLLSRLEADPQAQETLAEIIRQACASSPAAVLPTSTDNNPSPP